MKILLISTYDISGGASIAAFRLHDALIQSGIDSQMLVDIKKSDFPSVLTVDSYDFEKKIGNIKRILRKIINKSLVLKYKRTKSKKYASFTPQKANNHKLVKKINEINPDIVHLHWICRDFLSVEDIAEIKAPIVWSLHDMWAFTGGCHVVGEKFSDEKINCDEYVRNCGNCEILGSKQYKDLSFYTLQRKKKTFAKVKKMTIIGLSRWMADCASKSAVFADKKIVNIPNPLDTETFQPLSKEQCRDFWKLPQDKKLVLFGAVSPISRAYKGYDLLMETLNKVKTKDIECVVFGANEPQNPPKIPFKVTYLGNVNDKQNLVKLYSACDITISPSRRDNLSNVIMESLSCATPVACFDIGGNSDMVDQRKNGFLAQAFDTSDLANGIDWILNNDSYEELQKNAREKVVKKFDSKVIASKYLEIYKDILK